MIYSIDQTGAKTQLGGLKLGFIKLGNQVVTDDLVAIPEKYPIARHVATTIKIRLYLFMLLDLDNKFKESLRAIVK